MNKYNIGNNILLQFIACAFLLAFLSIVVPLNYHETRWIINWENVPEDLRSNYAKFHCLTVAENGDLWAGNDNGVVHISGQTWETYSSRVLHHIRDIEVAPNGEVWVLTERNDVLRFDGQNWQHFSNIYAPYDIAITSDGTVWGVDHTGLFHFNNGEWEPDKLSIVGMDIKDTLWTIDVAPDDSLWLGGYSAGETKLFHIKNNEVIFSDAIDIVGGIKKIRVNSLGQLWIYSMGYKSTICTFGYYENGKIHDLHFPYRFWRNLAEFSYDFAPANQGITWIATHNGLCRFNGYYCINYLQGESVYSVAASPDGNIWLGLENQIVKLGR